MKRQLVAIDTEYNSNEDMIDPVKDQLFYDNKDLDALMHKRNTNNDVFDDEL